MMLSFVAVVLTLVVLALARLLYVLQHVGPTWIRRRKSRDTCHTLIVLGSGGHTAEMLRILEGKFPFERYSPQTFLIATTDSHSEQRLKTFMKDRPYTVGVLPRAREVGQSYVTSIFTTLHALLFALITVFRERPDLILTNGPGTAIPVCAAGFLLRYLGLRDTRIVYVESVCRVQTLSLSAIILYYWADLLVVQWPELQTKFPRTTYVGRLT